MCPIATLGGICIVPCGSPMRKCRCIPMSKACGLQCVMRRVHGVHRNKARPFLMADPTSVLGLFNLFLWSAALQHCSAGSAWLCHMQQKHLSMSVRTQTIRPGSSYLRLIQLEMMPTCSFCRSRPNKSSEAVPNCEYNKKPRIRGFFLAPPVGLEPTTLRLTAACSTD